MSNHNKPRRIKRSVIATVVIVVFVLILLCMKCCSGCGKPTGTSANEPTPIANTEEENILQIMKRDEQYLLGLYNAPNICEKEWIEAYRSLGKTFQTYEYNGNNEEIKGLLKAYISYGKKIEEIAISIDKNNYEEGIKQLEELKAVAGQNEKELQLLYDKEFSAKTS